MASGVPRPPFRRVRVLGGGALGLRVALAFRARGVAAAADVVTDDPEVRDAAAARGLAAAGRAALLEGEADVLVLADPASAPPERLRECARGHPGALIMDLAALKRPVLEAAGRVRHDHPRLFFVGAHPLLPPPLRARRVPDAPSGEGADGELFAGVPVALCPLAEGPAAVVAAAEHAWRLLGAVPFILSAEEHDRWMALVEQLPAACSLLLAGLAARDLAPGTSEEHLLAAAWPPPPAGAGGADPAATLAALEANREAVAPLARRLAAELASLARELEELPGAAGRVALESRLAPGSALARRLGTG